MKVKCIVKRYKGCTTYSCFVHDRIDAIYVESIYSNINTAVIHKHRILLDSVKVPPTIFYHIGVTTYL